MNTDIKRVLSITLMSMLLSACGGEDTVSNTKENDSNTKNAQSTKYSGTQDDPILIEAGKKYPLNSNNAYNNFKIPKGKDVQPYGAVSPSLSRDDTWRCQTGGGSRTPFCTQGWDYKNSWNNDEGNRCINIKTYEQRKGYIEFVLIKAKEEEEEEEKKEIVSPYLQKIGSNGESLTVSSKNWEAVKVKETNLMIENKSLVASLTEYNHEEAVDYCSNLIKAGYNDWKIASIGEIKTIFNILNYSDVEKPYLKNFFESSRSYTWLEDKDTEDRPYNDYYYAVQSSGWNAIYIKHKDKVNTLPIWCVRSGSN